MDKHFHPNFRILVQNTHAIILCFGCLRDTLAYVFCITNFALLHVHQWVTAGHGGSSILCFCTEQNCELCLSGTLLRLCICCRHLWYPLLHQVDFAAETLDSLVSSQICSRQKTYFEYVTKTVVPYLRSLGTPSDVFLSLELLELRVKECLGHRELFIPESGAYSGCTKRFSYSDRACGDASMRYSGWKLFAVRLPNAFVAKSSRMLSSQRAIRRKKKWPIKIDCSFPPSNSAPLFIEWKLKNATLPVWNTRVKTLKFLRSGYCNNDNVALLYRVCHYCLKYGAPSNVYCPLEIFSLDFSRACRAVASLLLDYLSYSRVVPCQSMNSRERLRARQDFSDTLTETNVGRWPITLHTPIPSSYGILHTIPRIIEILFQSRILPSLRLAQQRNRFTAHGLLCLEKTLENLILVEGRESENYLRFMHDCLTHVLESPTEFPICHRTPNKKILCEELTNEETNKCETSAKADMSKSNARSSKELLQNLQALIYKAREIYFLATSVRDCSVLMVVPSFSQADSLPTVSLIDFDDKSHKGLLHYVKQEIALCKEYQNA